jgi:hypothetical protein
MVNYRPRLGLKPEVRPEGWPPTILALQLLPEDLSASCAAAGPGLFNDGAFHAPGPNRLTAASLASSALARDQKCTEALPPNAMMMLVQA